MSTDTYRCDECGGVFDKGSSDAAANAEAEALWGVTDAANDPEMAIVCDDCFKVIMAGIAAMREVPEP